MAGHTPGPWYCSPEADLHRIGVYTGKNEETIICDVSDEDLTRDEECEANAYLIAAAPEMLAALRQFEAWDQDPHASETAAALMRREVHAAIAKATDPGAEAPR
jgi:hypothetical protein